MRDTWRQTRGDRPVETDRPTDTHTDREGAREYEYASGHKCAQLVRLFRQVGDDWVVRTLVRSRRGDRVGGSTTFR